MKFKKLLTLALSMAMLITAAYPTAALAAQLKDISDSWAKTQIQSLVDDKIISGYPDGTFRPDKTVTRAEFAKMLTTAFNLKADKPTVFSDTKGHWAQTDIGIVAANELASGYGDDTFRPDSAITRAEMVAMVNRALGLEQQLSEVELDRNGGFSDVKADFWAAKSISAAQHLALLPPNIVTKFVPEKKATRAETAFVIGQARDLEIHTGTVVETSDIGIVTLKPLAGKEANFDITPDTLVYRNNIAAQQADLVVGDQLRLVSDQSGTPKLVTATGIASKKDVVSRVSEAAEEITKEILTPDQVQAVMAGDWGRVSQGLRYNLYDRLTDMELKPWEAEAILSQDWLSLGGSAKDRLASAVADTVSVSPELATALLNQDWESVKNFGQVEMTQKLLTGLLF